MYCRLDTPIRTIVVSGIALLAFQYAAPARACTPAPCFEASPNPVPLVIPATQGDTTIDWDAGPLPPSVSVTREVDGQETEISQMRAGIQVETIEKDKVYIFRIRVGDGSELVSVQVTTTGRRPMAQSDEPRRIRPLPPKKQIMSPLKILVSPFGTHATFAVQSKTPRNVFVYVSNDQPSGCSSDDLDIVSIGFKLASNYATSHSVKVFDLEPATNYFSLIKMKDESGQLECTSGKFRTRSRNVKLRMKDVFVFDDSDEMSAGDLTFGFFVNPTFDSNRGSHFDFFPASGEVDIDSDTTFVFDPNVVLDLGSMESATFNVTASDDDEWEHSPGTLNTCGGFMIPVEGSVSNDCVDSAGKTEFLYFGPTSPGQEEIVRDFKVRVVGGALEFEVTGQMEVTYQ